MAGRYESHGGEENAIWTASVADLKSLRDIHATGEGASKHVNRFRKTLQTADDEVKIIEIAEKLEWHSRDYAAALETELKLLETVRENIGLLTALRQATEAGLGGNEETRRKKRKMTETDSTSESNRPKKRNLLETLQPGSPVAFKQPKSKGAEGDWIQCNIIRISGEGPKARCEVQDPEPDENGLPGQTYKTFLGNLIPVHQENAGLPPYSKGSHVLARYPETTTFYRAEVMASRKDICMLRFEGEEEIEKLTEVERRLVLEIPKNFSH